MNCTIESCVEEATKAVLMNRFPVPLRPTPGEDKYHKAVECCNEHHALLVRMGFPSSRWCEACRMPVIEDHRCPDDPSWALDKEKGDMTDESNQYHRGDLIRETGTRFSRVGVVIGNDNGETIDVRWFNTRLAKTETFGRKRVDRIEINAVTVVDPDPNLWPDDTPASVPGAGHADG